MLGVDADQVLDVDLGLGGADVLEVLRTAVAEHRRVHLDYYSYGRDARTERDVDPYLVHAEDGSLVRARATATWPGPSGASGSTASPSADAARRRASSRRPTAAPAGVFQPDADDPRVELELDPSAGVGGRGLPGRGGRGRAPTARLRVRLAVAAEAWLERLLVGLGPQARVVDAPAGARGTPGGRASRAHPRPLPLTRP